MRKKNILKKSEKGLKKLCENILIRILLELLEIMIKFKKNS